MPETIPAGTFVRLRYDPARIGIATDQHETAGDRRYVGVRFPTGVQFVPEDQLERVAQTAESPVDFVRQGRFAEPARLRQVLTHIRLTGRLADVIYSMEATNTDFYAYQFKPVLKMLNAPTGGLLIADEVGLGKTIEAGLIWTELRARYDFHRLLVVCPKALLEKWRGELLGKFGIDVQVLDASGLLALLRSPERRERGFAAVCSIQGLRPPRGWEGEPSTPGSPRAELARLLRDATDDEPQFDLLVIDESHHVRNPETLLHKLASLLRPVSSYAVFLSATPIHLRNRDLFAQLTLLDPITFAREDALVQILGANRPLIQAREAVLRGEEANHILALMDEAARSPLLHDSRQLALMREELAAANAPLDQSRRAGLAYRLEQANLLGHVVTRTRRRDVQELRIVRIVRERFVPLSPIERTVYNVATEEVSRYAAAAGIAAGFLLATPQRMLASCMAAALAHWFAHAGVETADEPEEVFDIDPEETQEVTKPLIDALARACQGVATVAQLEAADTKYMELLAALQETWHDRPGEKVIVYSTFKPTLRYLARRLARDGIRAEVLHGSIREDKDSVITRFADPDGALVLLSSEIGSEGIDLQFARLMFNYDLPWNPMRVEQRIGRIDRIGQQSEAVTIVNLLHADTIDARIYQRLYERLDLCRHALGDFEAVLGDEIRRLTHDLLAGRLTPEQQAARIDQTAIALEVLKQLHEALEQEAAALIAHGDFILRTVRAAHELNRWIGGDDIRRYVCDFLAQHYPGCVIRRVGPDAEVCEVGLSSQARLDLADFVARVPVPIVTRLTRDGGPVRCRFTPTLVRSPRDRTELISQLHPLTRFVARKLQETDAPRLRPAVAARVAFETLHGGHVRAGRYAVAVMRWSLGGVVEIEKLAFAGARLPGGEVLEDDDAEILALTTASYGTIWPEAAAQLDRAAVAGLCRNVLVEGHLRFAAFTEERRAENDDRATVQIRTLERHRSEQMATLQKVLEGHCAAGKASLVRATEGRMGRLSERCERRRFEIEKARELRPSYEDIGVLVVEVT